MTFLKVMGGILLFILFILSLKATVTISYSSELALYVRVLFLKIRILPKKEKKKGPHSMTEKKAKKIKEKLLAKRRKKKEAAKKKAEAKKQKQAEKKSAPKKSLEEILDVISLVKNLASKVIKIFFSHLRIDVARIKINVGASDAASCAIAYGAITQAINLLFPILEGVKNFDLPKSKDIEVNADFLSETIEADIKLSFSIRVWHVLHVGLGALVTFISHKLSSSSKTQNK